MRKACKICGNTFTTPDSRSVTCGDKVCANKSRSITNSQKAADISSNTLVKRFLRKEDLPPPECLPADYLKQCADLWLSLTSEGETVRRVV